MEFDMVTMIDQRQFVEDMRSSSIYPAFRAAVQIIYWVILLMALVSAIGGVIVATGSGNAFAILIGLCVAAFLYVVAKVWREASLMIADLCDASVRLAMRSSQD